MKYLKYLFIVLFALTSCVSVNNTSWGASGGGGTQGGGGGGGSPTGPAGGDLGSTYPNPTVVSGAHVGAGTLPNAALVTTPITACSGDINAGCTQVTSGSHLGNATVPNAALVTTPITSITGGGAVSNNFVSAISSGGAATLSRPTCGNLSNGAASCSTDTTNASNISSGTLPTAQTAALTGDVTKSAGSSATTAVGGTHLVGGITQTGGSVNSVAIGTPNAPAIVSGFTGGTTDYYFCMGVDANGKFTISSAGTGTTGTTGTMSCGGQTGAVGYDLLRKASSPVPNGSGSFLVSAASPSCTTTSGVSCNVADAANSLATIVVPKNVDNTSGIVASNADLGIVVLGTGTDTGTEGAGEVFAPSGTITLKTSNGGITLSPGGGSTTTSGSTAITSSTGAIGPSAGGALQSYGGTLPTCACTGGSPTCTAQTGASNSAGELDVTGGTSMTTCTLTFSASGPFHAAPVCQFTDKNASVTPLVYSTGAESTSTVVFDFVSASAFNVNYVCIGH